MTFGAKLPISERGEKDLISHVGVCRASFSLMTGGILDGNSTGFVS